MDSGLVEMHGKRRWAHYRLSKNIEQRQKSLHNYEESIPNQRQHAVMQYVRQNGRVTVPEFIHLTGDTISERTAQRDQYKKEPCSNASRIGLYSIFFTLRNLQFLKQVA
jgi:hypothetical protein